MVLYFSWLVFGVLHNCISSSAVLQSVSFSLSFLYFFMSRVLIVLNTIFFLFNKSIITYKKKIYGVLNQSGSHWCIAWHLSYPFFWYAIQLSKSKVSNHVVDSFQKQTVFTQLRASLFFFRWLFFWLFWHTSNFCVALCQ